MRTKITLSVVAVFFAGTLLSPRTLPSRTALAQSPDLTAYGEPNPNAKELSHFAFLIGTWQADGKALNEDRRTWRDTRQRWTLRYILDGQAIAGVYQRQDEGGVWTTYVMDFRFYDRDQDRWIVEYVNPTTPWGFGSQAQEEVGGVQIDATSIAVMTLADRIIRRETFSSITDDHFTYRADVSADGETWFEIEASEVSRIED